MSNSSTRDKIVYFGVININEEGRTIGAIDIWRSAISRELFCEEKRLGILDIAADIGMPTIDNDKKWAVAINRRRRGRDRWRLIKIIDEGEFRFTDVDDETLVEVNVRQFKIIDLDWWSFLVENNVNHNIEITIEMNEK